MSPRQKLIAIRLSEKIEKNPAYTKSMGIEIKRKNQNDKEVLQH